MFRKILVANRGEIAIRAFRAAYELGARTVAVYPYEDRNSLHRLKADEAYLIGEKGHPVRAYLDVERDHPRREGSRSRRHLPGVRIPLREPRPRRAGGRERHRLHRPSRRACSRWRATRSRRSITRSRPAFPCCGRRGIRRHGRARRAGRRHRLPDLREGRRRWRRTRDATRRDARRARAGARRGHARGGQRLRRPAMFLEQAVLRPRHIEVQILADKAGTTVHLFERDCSVQRRHQKVDRDRAGAEPRLRTCASAAPHADRLRRVDRLRERRHGRVPARDRGRAYRRDRLHRDESAHPGRAHRDRGGHRRRPRAVADAHRGGADPRRSSASRRTDPAARRGAAMPHHHGGPDAGLPPRHRQDHDLPVAGWCRHPPRRRNDRRGLPDQPALRLDARQAHLPRPGLRARPSCARGARSPSSASAACPPTSRSCRRCSTTPTSSPAT